MQVPTSNPDGSKYPYTQLERGILSAFAAAWLLSLVYAFGEPTAFGFWGRFFDVICACVLAGILLLMAHTPGRRVRPVGAHLILVFGGLALLSYSLANVAHLAMVVPTHEVSSLWRSLMGATLGIEGVVMSYREPLVKAKANAKAKAEAKAEGAAA